MTSPDPHLYDLLAADGLGPELFNPRQHRACERVERYALHVAIDLAGRLGLAQALADWRTAGAAAAATGVAPAGRPLLGWLLARLAAAGLVEAAGDTYRLSAPLPPPAMAAIRAEALAEDAAYAPAYALLDAAAAIAPAVARGETSGEAALLRQLALWIAYFDNAHPYYALNNHVAARAVATRLQPGAAVLEVGAGLGSATAALLDLLAARGTADRLTAYRSTEPVAFFRRRAERTLVAAHPGAPLAFDALDIDAPWAAQGAAPGTQQIVWGVNVFHLARDLDTVLAEAYAALAPGGWLVAGEGLRPFAGAPVGAELPFLLLERFVDVTLDPATRPTAGFLTAEHWQAAFARAGFAPVETLPNVTRLRAVYPGFLAGAVCGRRPGTARPRQQR